MLALAVILNLIAVVLLGALLVMHLVDRQPDLFDIEDDPHHHTSGGPFYPECLACNPRPKEE